jgi:type I restriction enzyme S subunit
VNKVALESVGSVFAGQGAPKSQEFSATGVPFVRAGSLEALLSGKDESELELVSEEIAQRRKLKLYPKGSILFAKSGMSATKDRVYVLQRPAYVVSHLAVVIPKNNISAAYLRFALKEFPPSVLIKDLSYPAISLSEIKNHIIPIPKELDDQKRIALLLSKSEQLIAQRKEHLEQLDELLRSIFLEMFGDPVRNENGWDTLPFHKVGKFVSGGTPSKKREEFWTGNFPWVSPKDMKVTKIHDSIDHISEIVFNETSLKRIAPDHLLIVVRGMILAHSFPVAINSVEIAINQDMKAIKPNKKIKVVYLLHCLISMKRQILKLISTAGHGTRRFDSAAMEKLFIPKPPEHLQDHFCSIAEKVESIKSRYQQSLADLENLYGALSQKAFKGELDLSRVPLPAEDSEIAEVDESEADEMQPDDNSFELPAPADLALVKSPEGRRELVQQWLSAWLEHVGDEPFAAQPFMEAARQCLGELELDEIPEWGVAEYDELKAWLFKALEKGRLTQDYDDANNRVQVATIKG